MQHILMVGVCISKINNDNYMQLSGSANKVNIYKDTTMTGNSDVGAGSSTSNIKTSASHNGNTASCELIAINRDHGKFRCNTNYAHGTLYLGINNVNFSGWLIGIMRSTFTNQQQELQMTDLKKMRDLLKMLVKHYQN